MADHPITDNEPNPDIDNILSEADQEVQDLREAIDNESFNEPPRKNYTVPGMGSNDRRTLLSGMFREWFLEYASYVILERAVPHIDDGLKPVQRRILHSMQTLDDGRFNKVANIVGNTMQYHPHGDASIGDALVQLGQKELLVDTQGNWGNILTGDGAAAPRYIEARLSEFALETVFSPDITEWTPSYDGRKKEPVTLPVKFPLLLAQGVEGIAVGLSSKILPHNFNEILDAAVDYLEGRDFRLLPDFQTGGLLDASRYNDGARGGSVKVRAKIEKIDNKTLAITELPFGKNTTTLISSILSAMEKGKIKVRHVDNNTSSTAEILVHLAPGTSSDKAIDALYAFTDCEVSISPCCCVIRDKKPHFLTVSDLLRHSVDLTRELLLRELEIKLGDAREAMMFASLEKIFIENRMYKDAKIEQAPDMDAAVARIDTLLNPFKPDFFRPVTREDILRLWEIKMGRILKFNSDKANEKIARLHKDIQQIAYDIEHLTEFTINWYRHLKEKYGENYPRRTTLRSFDSIEATKVAEANKRLFFDKEGGFIGIGLKEGEFKFTCSDIDDILIIYRDGTYKIVKVQDKLFIGKKVEHIGLFKKDDRRTIYNLIYRNGKDGEYYKKRFFIKGLTRDKIYNMTKGAPGSKIEYLSVNPNGEAEVVKVTLTGKPNATGRPPRNKEVLVDFADLALKGKDSLGNLVTKFPVKSITLERRGASTLGGREVWFDRDVLRLNYDGRGDSLGIFQGDDLVLVITTGGEYYTTSYSDANHYDDNIYRIEKFDPNKVWTAALYDASQGYPYLKRFNFEPAAKPQRYVGADEKSSLLLLTDTVYPRLEVTFAGNDASRPALEIDAEEFIGVKSYKAKGKRITNFTFGSITELSPTRFPEPDPEPEDVEAEEVSDADDNPAVEASSLAAENVIQGDLFDFDNEEGKNPIYDTADTSLD
ncbi:MAG: DNA gyrase/topoisomerase IV subunit A [Muribaculaceae bacterium]|nr:DNA gyrase/topoisomerase IV subunit A [Muribaculaceae bacterium]